MSDDGVGFQHQVVAGVINLRFENLQSPVSTFPEVLHHLAREQVLEESLSV
jgi:hypothetical protein